MTDFARLANDFIRVLGMNNSPVGFCYTDEKPDDAIGFKKIKRGSCIISLAYQASQGKIAAADAETYGCPGAGRYLGFNPEVRQFFAEFLSCGMEDVVEGERYIKTPELAQIKIDRQQLPSAPAQYAVFAPLTDWNFDAPPEIVIFFVPPDILSALVVLSDYDNESEDSNTVVRFGSGCGQIVAIPLDEAKREHPRAVLGMFDISARPWVPRDILTFAAPTPLFQRMAGNIEGSFLQTGAWEKIHQRVRQHNQ